MKNSICSAVYTLSTVFIAFFISTEMSAQSLQFSAVLTEQYSLSGFDNEGATYTVPAGKVAKLVSVAGTNFCFQIGSNSASYAPAQVVLNGFIIPTLEKTICSGGTNNTLYRIELDQWMKAGDTFKFKLPPFGYSSPPTPSGSYLATIIEYTIVP